MGFNFIEKYIGKHFEIKPSLFLSDWICYEIVFYYFIEKYIHIYLQEHISCLQ